MSSNTQKTIQATITRLETKIKNFTLKWESPEITRAYHYCKIEEMLNSVEWAIPLMRGYTLEIKKSITNITLHDQIQWHYLIMCNCIDLYLSIIELAKIWQFISVMILLRTINEYLTLNELFLIDFKNWKNTNINKWFMWELIMPKTGREAIGSICSIKWKAIRDIHSDKYSLESQFAHCWYVSLLESISPVDKDYIPDSYKHYQETDKITSNLLDTSIKRYFTWLKGIFTIIIPNKEIVIKINAILN